MSVVTSHRPGTPCWVDIGSPDLERSISFYESLFGWRAARLGPQAGSYVMFRLEGMNVAAVSPSEGRAAWTTYFATADADTSVERILAAGGDVSQPPFDVPGAGRMAVASDPAGARFALWQAGGHTGSGIVDESFAPTWHELTTTDVDEAVSFYGEVFGWQAEASTDGAALDYRVMKLPGRTVAGIMGSTDRLGGEPPRWTVYFAVEDMDATVALAEELGGVVRTPARDTPYGRVAALEDPLGASFSVIQVPLESVA